MSDQDPMQSAVDRLMDCHGVTEPEAREAITEAMRATPIDETWQPIRGRIHDDYVKIERVDGELSPPIPWGDSGAIARELQRRTPPRALSMLPFNANGIASGLAHMRNFAVQMKANAERHEAERHVLIKSFDLDSDIVDRYVRLNGHESTMSRILSGDLARFRSKGE